MLKIEVTELTVEQKLSILLECRADEAVEKLMNLIIKEEGNV